MLGWVICPTFCSSVIPATIRQISASSAAASRADGFRACMAGQRDASGGLAEAGDNTSAPPSRAQPTARVIRLLPALGTGIIICIASDVVLLPIAECNLQHAYRPVAGTGEAMACVGRNPHLVARVALAD